MAIFRGGVKIFGSDMFQKNILLSIESAKKIGINESIFFKKNTLEHFKSDYKNGVIIIFIINFSLLFFPFFFPLFFC